MARETVTIYKSDLSGENIEDETKAVIVRFRFPGQPDRKAIELDALESEVADMMSKGREVSTPGRKPSR